MVSRVERFWLSFLLRFAFGFLFLIASINIFNYGYEKFAADMITPFQSTWVWGLQGDTTIVEQGLTGFLKAMPFVMAALSVPILTGIFYKPALRFGALFLICLGLGKYLQNDIATTAQDFLLAFLILIGLFLVGRKDDAAVEYGESPTGLSSSVES